MSALPVMCSLEDEEPREFMQAHGPLCDADAEGIAADFCEHREAHGAWAGDPMPGEIEVRVECAEEVWIVTICTDYEVTFSPGDSRKVTP
jgi:hypothetical protein